MASEQVHRGEVFSETFLEIREGDANQKQQDIRELHADRGRSQDKEVERKQREEAAKGFRDREEKETREKMKEETAWTMEHSRQARAKQREKEENSKYRAQERAKQEASVQAPRGDTAARNKDMESKAIKVTYNKERQSEKSTTKGFEEGKKQDQKEGKMKPIVVCETVVKVLPQKDNESNTVGSFERVQERDKAKNQGVLGETRTQHAKKMNKNRESNVLATYAEVLKGGDSAARRVQEQELNEILVEKGFEGENEESQVGDVQNLHMVKEKLEVTVTDSAAVEEQELDEAIVEKGFEGEKEESQVGIVQNLHRVNDSLDNKVSESGSTVLGAVGETVLEIGENMLKPAKKVIEKSEEGKEGGGVLSAIGETVAEIAETTKVIAVGDGESESKESIGSKTK